MKLSLKYFLSKWIPATIAVSLFIAIISCSDTSDSSSENGKLRILLTDAPACYAEVNVYIEKVKIHYAETDSSDSLSAWVELNTNNGYYNLLELRDSNTVAIVDDIVPAGKITQIRLMLADSNYVVTDNADTFKLRIPSGIQSGYKIVFCDSIASTDLTSILIDFDAEKSIIQKGNGEYQLKPVLKAHKVN